MATDMPPFSYTETAEDGSTVQKGIDYDALVLIAAQQNINYKIVLDTWSNCVTAIKAGRYDAFWSNFSITEERKTYLDFYSYFEDEYCFGVLNTNTSITKIEDLKDKVVVTLPNSVSYQVACSLKESLNVSVLTIENNNQRYEAVVSGVADAIIEDYAMMSVAIRDSYPTLKIAGKTGDVTELGIAVPKGKNAELLKSFEAGFKIIKDNKRWNKILEDYLQ